MCGDEIIEYTIWEVTGGLDLYCHGCIKPPQAKLRYLEVMCFGVSLYYCSDDRVRLYSNTDKLSKLVATLTKI